MDLHTIVRDRSTFFVDRVDTYARLKGFDNKTVVTHLLELAHVHGARKITGIIDEVVPAHLHSSRMPVIRKEVMV
jgi:hypothetical protein